MPSAVRYLRSIGIGKVPLASFIGNRFNTIFYDAAGGYHLRDHVVEFFQSNETMNRLLRSVEADLGVLELLADCKALGLIDKLVTGPLWRVPEDSNVSVIKMSDKYAEMERTFTAWSVDASELQVMTVMMGTLYVHKGRCYYNPQYMTYLLSKLYS